MEAQNERIEVFSKKMGKFIDRYERLPKAELKLQYENYKYI